MDPKKLIAMVDAEINLRIREEKKLDIGKLVDSYNLNEEYKPIVRDYVLDVYEVYSGASKKAERDASEIGRGISCLGFVISPFVGGGIGAAIGYFANGATGTSDGAAIGGMIGLLTEMTFHPCAIMLVHKYINAVLKSCEEPRSVYRGKALAKLEDIT